MYLTGRNEIVLYLSKAPAPVSGHSSPTLLQMRELNKKTYAPNFFLFAFQLEWWKTGASMNLFKSISQITMGPRLGASSGIIGIAYRMEAWHAYTPPNGECWMMISRCALYAQIEWTACKINNKHNWMMAIRWQFFFFF